jgi:hypothetical protein
MQRRVICSDCGYEFPLGHETHHDRDPCLNCGSSAITVEIYTTDELNVTEEVTLGVGPTQHDRDAARRWRETSGELARLEQPLPNAQHETIFDAQRRLHLVFIELWAMREAVIRQDVSTATVTAAIKNSPMGMALAHDLGNVAKHGPLRGSPMSPYKPDLGAIRAERSGSGVEWRFNLVVQHGPNELEGLKVARDAVDEWERYLKQWNLL